MNILGFSEKTELILLLSTNLEAAIPKRCKITP
jgi:hypothetical protein